MFSSAPKLTHMEIAMGELGQQEIFGAEDNERIVGYFTAVSYRATDDETPWCAAFANWVLMEAGIARTESAAALSFAKWGVKTTKPKYGDIVVFDHGNGRGHVGFFMGSDGKNVSVLGGNQNNQVNITKFALGRVAHFRTCKTAWASKTVWAAGTVAAVTVGQAVTEVVNQVATPAVLQNGDALSQVVELGNILLPFLPPQWQAPATAIVTVASTILIYLERVKKIKNYQK